MADATERVGIELQLLGYDGVLSNAKTLENTLRNLSKIQYRIDFDKELNRIKSKIIELRAEAEKFRIDGDKEGLARTQKKIRALRIDLAALQQQGRNATFTDTTWERYFNRMQAKIVQTGSRLQTLGKTISGITSPFTRFFNGMIMGAGYAALNKITSGFSGMFERYDVMKNYSRTLEAFGFTAEAAQKSVDKLNEAVLGLPTGLDEIIALQKVFVGASGDIEKATDLAIAANNTYLASSTDARQQKLVQRNLSALAGGGELAATTWDALRRAMPLAFREMATEAGYASDNIQGFLDDLKNGTISGEEFLKTFTKVGTSGAIADAANVMKMSFEGLSANITNATKRMGEAALKAVDEVFTAYNGRTLLQNLLGVDANGKEVGGGIKHWINSLSEDLQGWIKANPERITAFFERLKRIDIAGFIKGLAEATANVVEIASKLSNVIGVSNLGKLAVYGSILGKTLTIAGGGIKGFAGVAVKVAKLTRRTGGIFGLFFGREKGDIGGGLESAGKVGKLAAKMATGWAGVASKALTIAAIPVIAGSLKLAISALKDLGDMDVSWDRFGRNLAQLAIVFGGVGVIAGIIGAFPAASAAVAAGAGAIAAVGGAILALSRGLRSFNKLQVPTPETIRAKANDLKKIVKPIQDIIKIFDQGGIFKNIHKALQNWSASWIITTLGTIVDAVKGVTKKAKSLAKLELPEEIVTQISGLGSQFIKLGEAIQKIADAFDTGGVLNNLGRQLQTWSEHGIIKQLETTVTQMDNIFAAVKRLGGTPFDEEVMGRAGDWIAGIQSFFETHAATFNNLGNKQTTRDVTNALANITSFTKMFGQVSIMMEHLDNIKTEFEKYRRGGSFDVGTSPFATVGLYIQWVSDFIKDVAKDSGALGSLGDLGSKVNPANILNLLETFRAYKRVIKMIVLLSEEMRGNTLLTGTGGDMGFTLQAMRKLMEDTTLQLADMEGLMVDLGSFGNLAPSIQVFQEGLQQVGLMFDDIKGLAQNVQGGIFTEIETIKAALSQALSLGDKPIDVGLAINFTPDFGDSYTTTTEAISSVVQAVMDYTRMLDATTSKKVTVRLGVEIQHLDTVVRTIEDAARRIRDAINKIPTDVTRTVTVRTGRRYPDSYYESNGGLIYRAGGGSIFRPRGTDTVPAMLTPGEWVMRTKAVKKFGTEFMDRVNNLDINGAIRALHSRVGSTMSASQRTVVTNNHNDNRSYSNVQNINTNNPNFAFRRSRWVSELR